MERIAVISDIHSNITAFKAVLEDINKRGINRIFCAGDLVLKGSSPCECVDIARKNNSPRLDNYILELTTGMYRRNNKNTRV